MHRAWTATEVTFGVDHVAQFKGRDLRPRLHLDAEAERPPWPGEVAQRAVGTDSDLRSPRSVAPLEGQQEHHAALSGSPLGLLLVRQTT